MLVLITKRVIVLAGIAAAALACPALLRAVAPPVHEIPSDATIQAYIKPDGQRLHLIIRVPLRAMRDLDFPQRGPGYLDIPRADDQLRNAAMLWIGAEMALYEGDTRLEEPTLVAARASIPSNRSFRSYEEALAHVTGPRLADQTQLYWEQAMLDVLFEYPIQSDGSDFSIDPNLERLALRVVTVLRFVSPDGALRAFQYAGDPGLVRLDPRWHQAALRFVALGFSHILDGIDHLLFLLCLVIPFRRVRALVLLVTAFTVAHSITLVGSAFNLAPNALWFPPLVETLIAASIVYMALENVLGASLRRRWMITFAFGLVHGFGFSFGLRETLQFGGAHLVTSLLAFNVGVELGQLFALALLIPALELLYRFALKERERIGTIVLSALVAHTGWHWMTARGAGLGAYQWPVLNVALVVSAVVWLALMGGLAWLLFKLLRTLTERVGTRSAAAGAADWSRTGNLLSRRHGDV
jgi:hypothetical protein